MSSHTPGPWLYRGKSDSVHASSETHPYGEYLFAFQEECAPSDADIDLILAAPDLLEALQLCMADMVLTEAHYGDHPAAQKAIDQARAAIAKATGGAA